MPYAAHATQGTKLQVKITSTFTDVPGVDGIDGPGGEKTEIEVTAISDLAAKFVGGIRDFGEVSFNLFYDPAEATHAYLWTSFSGSTNTEEEWKVVLTDVGAAEIGFKGFVKSFKHKNDRNAAGMVAVVIRVTGAVTITV